MARLGSRKLLCALLVLTLGGCARERPDVLLFTIDTLRADHVGAYGYPRPTTPTIDALAGDGALFETAYAPMGTTCPSHATLFTARYPLAHGVVRNGLALQAQETTLAEWLAADGYATAAFVSSYPVSHRLGFDQGFESFDDRFEDATPSITQRQWVGDAVQGKFDRRGDETADAAIAWIESRPEGRPVFLWVHLFDPHAPYRPPTHMRKLLRHPGRGLRALMLSGYDGEIRFADQQVQRILQAFEATSRTPPLVILTGDHGEGLYDHGWPAHNLTLYEEEVRIPLVFRWPGHIPAGRRSAQPAHLVDIVPTLAGLLGLDAPEGGDGIDLSPHLTEASPPTPDLERALWLQRPYYSESSPEPPASPQLKTEGYGFGVRAGRWKYLEAPEAGRRELYDLEVDAREKRNLAGRAGAQVEAFSAWIAAWRREQLAKATPRQDGVSSEDLEALRALGYAE